VKDTLRLNRRSAKAEPPAPEAASPRARKRSGAKASQTKAGRDKPAKIIYTVKPGARISKRAASELGPIIDRLARAGKGPDALLREAENPRSPAHKHFDWDDAEAAKKFRLEQSRYYFRSVQIIVKDITEPVRLSHAIKVGDKQEVSWQHIQNISEDVTMMSGLLTQAQADLRAWTHRYSVLRKVAQMSGVFSAIEKVLSKN
jgi:hypothetical protein